MVQEKRAAKRVPVSMKVQTEHKDLLGFGYAIDLSLKGILIDANALSQKIPSVGIDLELKFMLPGTQHLITTMAKISRIENEKEPKIAAVFLNLDDQSLYEIEKFIQ